MKINLNIKRQVKTSVRAHKKMIQRPSIYARIGGGKKIKKNRELIERESTEILLLLTAKVGVICIKVFILLYRLKCKPKVTDR